MNIGIITCQWAYNYGAVLQAYALCSYLKKLGHTVYLLNYQPNYRRGIPQNGAKRFIKPVFRWPDWVKGRSIFGEFLKSNSPLTEPSFTMEQLRENCPSLDVALVGSDQVWGFHLPNALDDAYFLDFLPSNSTLKASYAASIATTKLTSAQYERLNKALSGFTAISVREPSSIQLLEQAGIHGAVATLDPVYLHTASYWAEKTKYYSHFSNENYVLIYCFGRPSHIYEYARALAHRKGSKLFCVSTFWEDKALLYPDKFFWNCDPFAFVGLIQNARAIVTNSFHGLSFSAIFEKELYLFLKNQPEDIRILDMINHLDQPGVIIQNDQVADGGHQVSITSLEPEIQQSKAFLCRLTGNTKCNMQM